MHPLEILHHPENFALDPALFYSLLALLIITCIADYQNISIPNSYNLLTVDVLINNAWFSKRTYLGGYHPWQFKKHDFVVTVGPKVPSGGPNFWWGLFISKKTSIMVKISHISVRVSRLNDFTQIATPFRVFNSFPWNFQYIHVLKISWLYTYIILFLPHAMYLYHSYKFLLWPCENWRELRYGRIWPFLDFLDSNKAF